ncbi:MAG: MG2 domain-containing protein [Deltaproteobacteria bacterium]|nr:MG2 domain-containing protein [Deltaproteobacteria bacterium]
MCVKKFIRRLSLLLIFLLLCSCGKSEEHSKKPDNRWEDYIIAHTAGTISRTSEISVHFSENVLTPGSSGAEVDNIFKFKPKIEGKVRWEGGNSLVFTPHSVLPSGEKYRASISPGKLIQLPEALHEFSFDFEVMAQSFEINMGGLTSPRESDATIQTLSGTLQTADAEENRAVEKILSAHQANKAMQITWTHSSDRRDHRFVVENIIRSNEESKLTLNWDGKPIDVSRKGEREIRVPKLREFIVTSVRSIDDDQQYIMINFSDPIDTKQNMKGLIRMPDEKYRHKIQGNSIRIYPSKRLTGAVSFTVEPGIRSRTGQSIKASTRHTVNFSNAKPGARFAGKGIILPENERLTIPIEAVSLNSVQVTAFKVPGNNIGRFFQVNKLGEKKELNRVGRYIWRKTINLNSSADDIGTWTRYNLDVTELFDRHPDSLFRLSLSFNRSNSAYSCSEDEDTVPPVKEAPYRNYDDLHRVERSNWEYAENYYNNQRRDEWSHRKDPCHDAYYKKRYNAGVESSRNFLASNIGLIAKRGEDGKLHMVTTDIRTAEPLPAVNLKVFNFQNDIIAEAESDSEGFAQIESSKTPFYMVAQLGKQKGYMKLNNGSVLPVSHFDVGGEKVNRGIKGYIYGERGVWRPGDSIYLTFVLEDKQKNLPEKHPVTLEFYNPKGQLRKTLTQNKPVGKFYAFHLETEEDAPTGNWKARAKVGGLIFDKTIKIEMVIPNRLKVNLDFGKEILNKSEVLNGRITSQWLHGAKASKLKTDVAVNFSERSVRFDRYADYVFRDPARSFSSERQVLYEGTLDEEGTVAFQKDLELTGHAPGMLSAHFTTRVFEESGAFSADRVTFPLHLYPNYVGIKTPKGDEARGMLLTDVKHEVEVATLDNSGNPLSLERVEVNLYKINWKWWWDKSGDSLANYASSSYNRFIAKDVISTKDGLGKWEFEIKYPQWGRYLIRACDLDGNHCTGKIFYIDWPGWAGRAREEKGVGASMLSFAADKKKYTVGETAVINLPAATQGMALLSLEKGAGIIEKRWINVKEGENRVEVPLTAEMSPNVYVHVSLIQPHKDKKNDRPIRLYGVISLEVDDPATAIEPLLEAPHTLEPEAGASLSVKEQKGRPMTYTLAIVDEGLLGLTRYRTPELRKAFYKKESLSIKSWDLFDEVVGAYGAELERLLALGGDEQEEPKERAKKKRFPPVVKFLGPFRLEAGEEKHHHVKLPPYIGAVRVMVVAGDNGAYGSTEKTIPVKKPLMVMATLPRVLGPDEELDIPVAVFSMEPSITEVKLTFEADSYFEVKDRKEKIVRFTKPGDEIAFFRVKVRPEPGMATLKFRAESGSYRSKQEIHIPVRSANPKTTRFKRVVLEPGKSWDVNIIPHGMKNTNKTTLEISAVPPLNLERRLGYLIRYPHGCIEQTTSSVFPQLYLPALVSLKEEQKNAVQGNIDLGIERLSTFQRGDGGFGYWPGNGKASMWGTNYAGHFLVEASKLGYHIPSDMMSQWISFQKSAAHSWTAGHSKSELDQAYRLFTLSLANNAQIGAMNRLRESNSLNSPARWMLAAAYNLAGQSDAAEELIRGDKMEVDDYIEYGNTFGSGLRDRAMILQNLVLMDKKSDALPLVKEISHALSSEKWYGTQTTAYSLLALAKFVGTDKTATSFDYLITIGKGKEKRVASTTPIYKEELRDFPLKGSTIRLKNPAKTTLYAAIISTGIPKSGHELPSSKGLNMEVNYMDMERQGINISEIKQGVDFMADIEISNRGNADYENLALTQIVPSGWEIHNPRMDAGDMGKKSEIDYQDIRDDRVYTYFNLKRNRSKTFRVLINASYKGKFYLPGISVEAMYDAAKHARVTGQWIEIVDSFEELLSHGNREEPGVIEETDVQEE